MSIKKSDIEDKSIKHKAEEELIEFNYPEHNLTVKARDKMEADRRLKQIISQE